MKQNTDNDFRISLFFVLVKVPYEVKVPVAVPKPGSYYTYDKGSTFLLILYKFHLYTCIYLSTSFYELSPS